MRDRPRIDVTVRYRRVPRRDRAAPPRRARRILVLDGAMGTMIQELKLDEAGYRGARFADWPSDLRGNNDLLDPDAARRDPRHPSRLFPRRRRHRRDQHVLLDPRSPRPTTACQALVDELNRRRRAARPGGRRDRGAPRTAARASSPAPSARPTAPPRSRPTSTIRASAPSPSTSCALAYGGAGAAACSTAAPTSC